MVKRWTACASENFHAGRPAGLRPTAIVLHRSGGSLEQLRRRFASAGSSVSAHYSVGQDGSVLQHVNESDTAFHAGLVVGATWPALVPRTNPNFYTIGIEHEGSRGEPWPDAQRAASAALIAEVAERWSIPIDAEHVVPHSRIRASADCPGASYPLDRILADAKGFVVVPGPPPTASVRTLVHANLREAPFRTAPVVQVLPAGTELTVGGTIDTGERVEGNSFWYVDPAGRFLWAGATNVPQPPAAGAPGTSAAPVAFEITTDEMELSRRAAVAAPAPELPIDRVSFALASNQYYPQATRKDLIILHFTAGMSARSAVDTWRGNPEHVATAYVVDVDGKIYEVFPPSCWAYHLGVKHGEDQERRAIGIEIANVGPLEPAGDGETLNWWPPGDWKKRYCSLQEQARYVARGYRGKSYFATFPDVQTDSVARLVQQLCERFEIPRQLPPTNKRAACDLATFGAFRGIATHANYREDKWDIGPAFDWDRLGM